MRLHRSRYFTEKWLGVKVEKLITLAITRTVDTTHETEGVSHAGALRPILSLLLIENPKLWLGAAESFVDDFFWSWWRFEISVFNLVSVGSG